MLNKPKRQSNVRFTGLLMFGALLGKLFGFVREILFARALGANFIADSFRGAMTAILLPIAPLQGDMIPSVLVPLHKKWLSENRSKQMMSSLTMMFGLLSTLIMVIVIILAPYYVDFLVGGFTQEAKQVTIAFVRIMALAMPASVLINCCTCIEISNSISRLTAIRASVQNISVILGIGIMILSKNPISIAWGFTFAMNIVALYGLTMLRLEGEISLRSISIARGVDSFKTFLIRVRSLMAQPLFDQGNILIEKILSSDLITGSLASLDYARTLTDTMVYFISQPIGYVVLSQAPSDDMRQRVHNIAKPILILSMPASAFLFVYAQDLVTLVFKRGAFQERAIELTSHAIQGISLGLWAAVVGWILVRFLNASNRNNLAAKIFVVAYIGNIAMNFLSYRFAGVFGIGMGEATRGILLLVGTSYALGSMKVVAKLIIQTVPLALCIALAGLLVQHIYETPMMRILSGSALSTCIMLAWIAVFMPEMINAVKLKIFKAKPIGI